MSTNTVTKHLNFMQAVLAEINHNRPLKTTELTKKHGVSAATVGVLSDMMFIRQVGNSSPKCYVWVPSNSPTTSDARKLIDRMNEIAREKYKQKRLETIGGTGGNKPKVLSETKPAIIAHTAETVPVLKMRTLKITLNGNITFDIPVMNGSAEMTIGDSKVQIAL